MPRINITAQIYEGTPEYPDRLLPTPRPHLRALVLINYAYICDSSDVRIRSDCGHCSRLEDIKYERTLSVARIPGYIWPVCVSVAGGDRRRDIL